jgi:hypothetical protein
MRRVVLLLAALMAVLLLFGVSVFAISYVLRSILALGLAGAVGFGIGVLAGDLLRASRPSGEWGASSSQGLSGEPCWVPRLAF